jgi:hypothetical protein
MENQHYVPKSYLKQFSSSNLNEIYAIEFIKTTGIWTPPRRYHINTICFTGDFYNLDSKRADHHKVKKDVIERNAFWYEKNFISDIVEQAEGKKIGVQTIPDLAFFLLSMKWRNPKFRNGYTKENINKALEKSIEELNDKFKLVDNSKLNKIAVSSFDQIRLNPPTPKNLHNGSILKGYFKNNEVFQSVLNKVCKYNITIYTPKDPLNAFITTDSPGYSVDKNKDFFNTKYIDDLYHFIPISSKLAIGFHNPEFYTSDAKISYHELNSEEIFQLNYGSAVIRTKNIYCSNKDTLNNFIDRVFAKK